MYNLLNEGGFMSGRVSNAADASKIVKQFLKEMGWDTFSIPMGAHQVKLRWIVYFLVGTISMKFEINAETGEIIEYKPLPSRE